jgi:isoleucyl-tRNA synthetase
MLHRTSVVFSEITESFDRYQYSKFFQTIQNFCTIDLSNFYLDIAKDRLYIGSPNSFRRRSCQTVLAIIVENLARSIAPVLCHMAEDIWQYLPYPTPYKSVFEAGWLKLDPQWSQPDLALTWDKIRALRTDVNKVMEQARTDKAIGSSLEAKVLLQIQDPLLRAKLASLSYYNLPVETTTQLSLAITHTPTPNIDKLVQRLPLLVVEELRENGGEVITGAADLLKRIYHQQQRPLLNLMLLAIGGTSLYIALGLIEVVNRIPLFQPALEAVGVVMSGVFVVRNLGKISQRKATLDRIATYTTTIIGTQSDTARIVSLQEPSGDLTTTLPASTPTPLNQAKSNGVDELRYLFLASQVELIDDAQKISSLQHQTTSEAGKIGVTTAEGEKCDRCWNYSPTVGQNTEHPAICDRCVDALAGNF